MMRMKILAILGTRQQDRARHGVITERRMLQLLLVAGAGLFIVAALKANGGTALLSLFACLACATRIEHNYGRGDYERARPEELE
jgi:hypothetical protein